MKQKQPHFQFPFTHLFFLLIPFLLLSCSSLPQDIKPIPTHSSKYLHLSCEQINRKTRRLESDFASYSHKQKAIVNAQAGIIFLFWPSIFAMPTATNYENEIAVTKGELYAIRLAQEMKSCS